MKNKHKGSSIESFLEKENLLLNAEAIAIKRVISYELEQALQKNKLTKAEMAKKMRASRSALDRLLDPDNTSITLSSLVKAVRVLGKKLKLAIG